MQPTKVHSPSEEADCHWLGPTVIWGRSPAATLGPSSCRITSPAFGEVSNSSGAPE